MVGVARELCKKYDSRRTCILDDAEILQLIKHLKFVIDIEDRLFRFINCIVSDEIERETMPNRQPLILQLEVASREPTSSRVVRSETMPKIKQN